MKIGIIGGTGWIGSALGRALIETGRCVATDLILLNRSGTASAFFGYPVKWAKNPVDLVDQSDLIIASVRPQDWPALALDARGKLVISVMAGVPIRALPPRTLRALPNAAAELRQSYTPWFANKDLSEADRRTAEHVLSAIGFCEPVASEHHLDLMTATVGAGPAYPALMAKVLIEFLVDGGVTRPIAERAAEGIICGAAPLLAGKMDQVALTVQVFMDYKGTTAAGLEAMIAQGFEVALKAGFQAATDRARSIADED